MMSMKWILLIVEDETFRTESVNYAVNLAKRINCSISVLMLTTNKDQAGNPFISEPEIVKKVLNIIKAKGVNTQGISRSGDKASELLKHLTTYPSFEAVIWGGKEKISLEHSRKKTDHWLAKIKTTIQCPVINPTKKRKKT